MIALITDFGNSENTGVIKGVIYSINDNSKIIDLFHYINPHNIKEAAWILCKNYKFFPKKTVFLCIVDPGVGTKRQCIAVRTKNYYFVGPDNGLMYKAAEEDGIIEAVKLPVENASMTFHGRDIFARAAAKLEKGIRMNKLGKKSELKTKLDFHLKGGKGEVVRIDNFGNIITNLPHLNKKSYDVKSEKLSRKLRFYNTYHEAPDQELFLIKGSSDTLEISLKNASASKKLKLNVGDIIEIS